MKQYDELCRAAGDVSRETYEQLLIFERLFHHWNKSINLAASGSREDFWSRHIVDSAQLWRHQKTDTNWTDIGSGGGLPGIVVAVLGKPAGVTVTLVESNRKKAAFLRSAAVELGLTAFVRPERVETAVQILTPAIVSARALAPLSRLLDLTERWLRPEAGRALFPKGRDFQQEIREARDHWRFDLVEHASMVDAMSRVLELSNVERLEH
ncbi:MAG: 16S rRNA (guanine(527)-N(7))-methyltransferase RsmG [Rhizobiaceae bacterium]|nr:16S rRNA (guanine(527)-N(7))-methyltransferase RsmG [Rhizobiaceae bacterium]